MDIDKEKYKFREYDSKYPLMFEKEKEKLQKILGKDANIEHIGSTSIIGLGGKGIIDITASVSKNNLEKSKKVLKKNNWIEDSKHGQEDRFYFFKKKDGSETHLHLTYHDSLSWKKAITTRNYLRNNKKSREIYEKIKKEGVNVAQGSGEIYRKHKHAFLQEIMKTALE